MARKRRTTKKKDVCCPACGTSFFPALLLLVGIAWFLSDLGYIAMNLPWWPLIVILFALKMMWKHKMMHTCM